MSGHSHWAGIKFRKGAADAKRGKLFSKLSKAIIIAARDGGGDPSANLKLRYAIDNAKANSMPKENIERAIKRGTGELADRAMEECVYEGYGPGGVAVLCEVLTDNRNRTASELRKLFEVHGGKLGASGCVAWMFAKRGLVTVPAAGMDEDRLMEIALEAGADDLKRSGDTFEVTCDPAVFQDVRQALADRQVPIQMAQIMQIPSTTVELGAEEGRKVLKLVEALEDHDDVQSVSANFNIPDAVLEAVAAGT